MITIIVLSFVITLIIGVPIAFVLGLGALGAIVFWNPMFLKIIAQRMVTGMDSFPLMAIPFFMLAGDLMNRAGITKPLIDFADTLVGHIRGGLAHVNIVASMFFAGITGAAVADTAALGSILIPAMVDQGYEEDYSAAVTAASSVIGPIIPPSIIIVVYAMTAGVSVGGLFMAGFAPGVLIGLSMMVVAYYYAVKRGYPRREEPITLKQFLATFKKAILPLLMPIIILGGILSGVFTPTEAAVVAVAYAFIVGFFITKALKLKDIPDLLVKSGMNSASILVIIATANVFSWILTTQQIPQIVGNFFLTISDNPFVLLFVLNILLLIVGMFMETSAAILILVPILAPVFLNLGIDPLHLGIIFVTNLCIGLSTPPLGVCLFVATSITDVTLEDLSKAIFPFLAAEIVALLLVTYVPALPLFLPRLFGY